MREFFPHRSEYSSVTFVLIARYKTFTFSDTSAKMLVFISKIVYHEKLTFFGFGGHFEQDMHTVKSARSCYSDQLTNAGRNFLSIDTTASSSSSSGGHRRW